MAEYKVTINATPSKAKVISVSPKNVQNTITASPDTSLYFSNLSKKWATEMDGMVNGEDYSSKYYANVSAENAQISQTNAQACEDARVLLQGEYNEYSEELISNFENYNNDLLVLANSSKAEINSSVESAQQEINTVVNNSKQEINTTKNNAIAEINETSNNKANIDLDNLSELGLEVLAKNGGGAYVGQTIFSLLPLNEAGLHLLDGTILDGNGIYKGFVDYIKGLDLTGNCFTTEANWQASVSTYGVCGKFVYNSSANTVRLPKVTGLVEGTIDSSALGDLIEAGLPNITGTLNSMQYNNGMATGAFNKGNATTSGLGTSTGSVAGAYNSTFDASRSSSVYGNSTTVQPQTIKGYYYIVVATSTKTDIEVDIDNVVTDLNGKVNKSGDTMTGGLVIRKSGAAQLQLINTSMNKATPPASTQYNQLKFVDNNNQDYGFLQCRQLSSNSYLIELGVKHQATSGYTTFALGCDKDGNGYVVASGAVNQYMAKQPMPSTKYITLTAGAESTVYTAPADGWVCCNHYKNTAGNTYITLYSNNLSQGVYAPKDWNGGSIVIPVKKGDTFGVSGHNNTTTASLKFIYAEGSK